MNRGVATFQGAQIREGEKESPLRALQQENPAVLSVFGPRADLEQEVVKPNMVSLEVFNEFSE